MLVLDAWPFLILGILAAAASGVAFPLWSILFSNGAMIRSKEMVMSTKLDCNLIKPMYTHTHNHSGDMLGTLFATDPETQKSTSQLYAIYFFIFGVALFFSEATRAFGFAVSVDAVCD